MGLSMDGVMIYLREEEWKELKVGCVFEVIPRPVLDPKTGEWHEQGHADEIAVQLAQLAEQKPERRAELLAEAGYFEKNKHRMNYMEMREEGWVLGSGMVESGGKQYKARFAGSGMRWSQKGAEHLLPVRTAILSKCFDKRWKAIYANSPKK